MENSKKLIKKIKQGEFDEKFKLLYRDTKNSQTRYINLINNFIDTFGENDEIEIFSAPGRSEIIGNHTDHQKGMAIGASVNLDIIGAVSLSDNNFITVKSEGYDIIKIDLNDLEIKKEEENTSASLIRGCANKFFELGYKIKGFNMYTSSNVLKGSGLSSSAAFENIIATVMNILFCNSKEDSISIAKIGNYAENKYFMKPSGMLDQTSSSVGGFVFMDFKDTENPVIEKIDFDFAKYGYNLCIVDTGGNHAALTDEYSAISYELRDLCKLYNKNVLREIDEKEFMEKLPEIRGKVSDRAVLRALHIYDENKRVLALKNALEEKNFDKFLKEIKDSGNSSFKFLQNVYSTSDTEEQGLSLALCLSEKILDGRGACRVHGGGFAGTIQAFVPEEFADIYKKEIEKVFGKDKCYKLFVRSEGGIKVF